MSAAQEHEDEIARLQSRLGDLLVALGDSRDDANSLAEEAAFAAADELIAYEERVPELLGVQPRRISQLVVRGGGAFTMVAASGVALAVIPGRLQWWWLLIAIVLALAGARLLSMRLRHSQAEHVAQRWPAGLVATAGLLCVLAALGLARILLLAVAAVVLLAAALTGFWSRRQLIISPPEDFTDLDGTPVAGA